MAGSALNVREDQWSADRKALRVARQNYYAALRLVGRQVVLYRPRGERDPGYYGLADIINVEPDRCDAQRIWIKIDNVSAFDAPISLDCGCSGRTWSWTIHFTPIPAPFDRSVPMSGNI